MYKVDKEITSEGKEFLTMEGSFKTGTTTKNVEPKIPEIEEENPVQIKTNAINTQDIQKLIDSLSNADIVALKPKDELTPEDVVYDKSGAVKYDGKKPRIDLIPSEALLAMGDLFRHGAKKYSDRNWEKGMAWGRMYGSLQRHLISWWGGEDLDPETRKSHLDHAACCIAMLIAYEKRGTGTDDRHKG